MKRLQTTLCCIAFAIIGVCIASNGNKDGLNKYSTITAATLPSVPIMQKLPIDLQLDQSIRNKKDTVFIRDTVRVTNKPKRIRVPYKVTKTDTVYQNIYFVLIPNGNSEEQLHDRNDVSNDTLSKTKSICYD